MHSGHQDLQSTLRPCRLLSKHSTMGQGLSEPLHLHFQQWLGSSPTRLPAAAALKHAPI